jgi:L-lactate dehydrogenase complex protein LldF
VKPTAARFQANARRALLDEPLQRALARTSQRFVAARRQAVGGLPEFDALRDAGRAIRERTLAHLDRHLEDFERQVDACGGIVHWALDADEARRIVTDICQGADARLVAKAKTMVGEEIGINEALEGAGMEVVETDLGEYILQLAGEPPSHIIAPAVHKHRDQIAELFREHHRRHGLSGPLEEVSAIVDEAREVLRERFLHADVGITGANFLVAETGSAAIVTNEGNADLTATLPRVHVVLASLEKVVPTLADLGVLLRLLARSATGQDFTAYTSLYTGPRRPGDPDGPEQFHVVLVDNGRSTLLGSEFQDMLGCIRCGACLNHCPVYTAIGGHAYGWVYPGPMGSVLSPLFLGLEQAGDLPNASTLCGRCEEVCPVGIPLPQLLRTHRVHQHARGLTPTRQRLALRVWAAVARRPTLYRLLTALTTRLLAAFGRRRGALRRLPLASGWTATRDLPVPPGPTFFAALGRRGGERGAGS